MLLEEFMQQLSEEHTRNCSLQVHREAPTYFSWRQRSRMLFAQTVINLVCGPNNKEQIAEAKQPADSYTPIHKYSPGR